MTKSLLNLDRLNWSFTFRTKANKKGQADHDYEDTASVPTNLPRVSSGPPMGTEMPVIPLVEKGNLCECGAISASPFEVRSPSCATHALALRTRYCISYLLFHHLSIFSFYVSPVRSHLSYESSYTRRKIWLPDLAVQQFSEVTSSQFSSLSRKSPLLL